MKKFLDTTTAVSLFAFLFSFSLSSPLWSEPVLPGLFSDHMVLQRGHEISVWGWADPGETVSVSLGSTSRSTVTGTGRRWRMTLPPMEAGGPFLLTVRGQKTILVKDVMIGEVWVLSGQSNMTFTLSGAEGAATEIPAADYPEIRLFTVPEKSALEPQENVAASWKICTPETAKEFSAVGYFFGRELYQRLRVPVGLIHSSWPGTAAENWATSGSLRSDPALAPILQTWAAAPAASKQLAAQPVSFDLEFDDFELLKQASDTGSVPFSNFDDGTTHNSLGGVWTYDWQSAPNTTFELVKPGNGGSGYVARVLGQLTASDSSVLRTTFTPDRSAVDFSGYSGVRFRYRGTGHFCFRTMQPSISDYDDYTSQPIEATSDWRSTTIYFKDLKQAGWGVPAAFTPQSLSGFALEILRAPIYVDLPPSSLFNGMIAPLLPFSIRGAVWYQGEGNASRAYQYRKLLSALIRGWRESWSEGDFPFLIVQLPNYGSRESDPGDSAWAELREAQLMALRLPNTGLAVTIDLGEANNVHPHRKAEVGLRLAVWALGTTYQNKLTHSGPLYDSMQIVGNRIRIHFKNVGSGLEAHGEGLRGFAIAGADRVFRWADASIEGDTVVVSSSKVADPLAVRYAWAGNPDCNLYNRDGLPASPFRTDDWPGSTVNSN